jgi:two-component system, OmpR family, sensor histidine kinase KdpD
MLAPRRYLNIALWGLLAPALCTLIAWPFRTILGSASILMTYNLGVFLVAARYGRGASILASLLSIPAFAFFFAPPIFSFAISDIDNIIGLSVMLVVANLTSNLLDKIRLQADIASQRENQATALYRLNRDLSETVNENMLARTAVEHLYEHFHVASVLLLPNMADKLVLPNETPLPSSLRGIDLSKAQRIFNESNLNDPSSKSTDSPGIVYLPLLGSQRSVGLVAMHQIDKGLQQFLHTFLHQIALTLERLRLATQASEAKIQAEAEISRNSLLSAISHDLRTPLTRIVGAASTLIDDGQLTVEERQDFNKVIQDEAQRMSELMNKILDMARLSAGTLVLHREWHNMEEIVGGALTRMEKMLIDRPIKIQLSDKLPLVWIDGVLVQQVLLNLLENITKYTPVNSPIEITAELLDAQLALSEADRGPGVPAGVEEKLFEKFYRLEHESSKNGIGLGLSLCRSIMEAHAGTIAVSNRANQGAVFTITLPLHTPPVSVPDEPVDEK